MKAGYKKNKFVGIGGIRCSCCRPLKASQKANKSFLNRYIRRTAIARVED